MARLLSYILMNVELLHVKLVNPCLVTSYDVVRRCIHAQSIHENRTNSLTGDFKLTSYIFLAEIWGKLFVQ